MKDAELRAAAGRLRGIEGPTFHGVGGKRHISEREYADAVTLAIAYLAEHPVDDDEPVTPEWLATNGFHRQQQPASSNIFGSDKCVPAAGSVLPIVAIEFPRRNSREVPIWAVWVYGYERNQNFCPTRGDVRRLCKALGIELKSPATGPEVSS